MSLSPGAKTRIQSTTRDFVEQTTSDLRRYFASGQWLAKNNRYRSDTVTKATTDFGLAGGLSGTKQTNLAHYIASSAQMHCIDGWSYLASSISALVRGDSFAAVHLAYYAELRAAMSILATDGIGVLNRRHCSLTAPKKADKIPGPLGTHEFTWLALKEWSAKNTAGDIVSESLTPFGIQLGDWFSGLPGTYTLQPLATSWIRKWGLDLQRLADHERGDRRARNEASYRPTALFNGRPVAAEDAIRVSGQLWEMCEPVGSSKFERLDRKLLRYSIKAIFEGRRGVSASTDDDEYRHFVSSLVNSQNLASEAYRNELNDYLLRDEDSAVNDVVQLAKVSISHADHAQLGVVSRSFLLLRLASGAVDTTLRKAGVRETDLSFWKKSLMSERGLCDPEFPPDELGDLWQDVDDGLAGIRERLDSDLDKSLATIRQEFDDALLRLAGFDAVPLWAIARV